MRFPQTKDEFPRGPMRDSDRLGSSFILAQSVSFPCTKSTQSPLPSSSSSCSSATHSYSNASPSRLCKNMTLKGGTSQACAACKYQRRKCKTDCPLAPFFPPDQPKLFQNAHNLFGVRNILNILKNLDHDQKSEAMRSIIYQSNMRDRFPINGCWEVICYLRYQLQAVEEEFHGVLSQLEMHRQHQFEKDLTSQLELGMGPPTNSITLLNQSTVIPAQNEATYNPICFDFRDSFANPSCVPHPFADNNLYPVQEKVQNYDEMQPFYDTMDDRHSYIDSNESSSEESLKDSTLFMEHVADNQLKFHLTNSEP